MNEKVNDGGPAFPVIEDVGRFDDDLGKYVPHLVPQGGLTKREVFALGALQGILAQNFHSASVERDAPMAARDAVAFADALLRELKKKPE